MRFSLLLELARRDFSERYAGSVLGLLWALLLPLVMIFIYTVIFSRVMGAPPPQQRDTLQSRRPVLETAAHSAVETGRMKCDTRKETR